MKKADNKTVAIIPARGGSKRIPEKNIIDFMDKPLIAWTIEAAIESKLFSKIIVSTDSQKIADVATSYGAEVPFLRNTASDDFSPVSLATLETLERVENEFGEKYDTVVQLFSVCPLRNSTEIIEAVNYFENHSSDFLISCYKMNWMNPWWAFEMGESNIPKALFPKALGQRSQDLPELYGPTGAIWIAKTTAFKKAKTFYGDNYCFYPISWESAIDIDNYEDLELARAAFLKINKGGN